MRCQKCGSKLPENAKFCIKCGTSISSSPLAVQSLTSQIPKIERRPRESVYTDRDYSSRKNRRSKPDLKKILFIVAIIVAAAIVLPIVGFIIYFIRHNIDMNDYLIIETSGYNTLGTASVRIDWDAIEEKYGDRLSITTNATDEYGFSAMMMSPIDVLRDNIYVKLEESTGLSNGDEIHYTWVEDDDLKTYVTCSLDHEDGSYTVLGLTELSSFNPFEDIIPRYEGIAPDAKPNFAYDGSMMNIDDFYYDYDNSKGLKNGDKIKLCVNKDNLIYYADNYGKIPSTYEKEYTVEGVEYYIEKLSELDDPTLKEMQATADKYFDNSNVKSMGDDEKLVSLTYLGSYLFTKKDDAVDNSIIWKSPHNEIFLIYRATVHETYSNDSGTLYDKDNDFYWFIKFQDLIVGNGGKVQVDLDSVYIPSHRVYFKTGIKIGWQDLDWYYNGFETIDELYDSGIKEYRDYSKNYNSENNLSADNKTENTDEIISAPQETSDNSSSGTDKVRCKDNVNIRADASTDADILGKAKSGDVFPRYDNMDNGWSKIDYNGTEAYIKTEFLETVVDTVSGSYADFLSQLEKALSSNNSQFIKENVVYKDPDSGEFKYYPASVAEHFTDYMSNHPDKLKNFINEVSDENTFSENSLSKCRLLLPLLYLNINSGYENLTVSISGFDNATLNAGQSAVVSPVLPCVYHVIAKTPKGAVEQDIELSFEDGNLSLNIGVTQ